MKRPFVIVLVSLLVIFLYGLWVFILNKNLEKGALQVTSVPASKVYLDGKSIGQTPLSLHELDKMPNVGTYNIRLVPSEGDFTPFEQRITIFPKVFTVVDWNFAPGAGSSGSVITLQKLSNKNQVSLSVVSFPSSAKLTVDSAELGLTPFKTLDITESDHDVKLTKENFEDKEIRIKTTKGYQLNALVFLGANQNLATPSALPLPQVTKILILDTPTGFLRVRSEPSLNGSQVGQVLPGEKYDLLDEQNGWFKIKLKDGSSGWVSSQYSQKQS